MALRNATSRPCFLRLRTNYQHPRSKFIPCLTEKKQSRFLTSFSNDSRNIKDETHDCPRVIQEETIYENLWIRLKTIHFLDRKGIPRKWTGVERTISHPKNERNASKRNVAKEERCDAVVVFPFLVDRNCSVKVILIRQFRPAVGQWVLELPAGLIDREEGPVDAAFRELKEETGYIASKVLHMGPPMLNDQGIANGNCRMVLMEVRMEEQGERKQNLEEDEMIEVIHAPLQGLRNWLLEQKEGNGDAVDARLYSYALGLEAIPSEIAKYSSQ